jgi:hypothetical protein
VEKPIEVAKAGRLRRSMRAVIEDRFDSVYGVADGWFRQ